MKSTWGRWYWGPKHGFGRWHAIAGPGDIEHTVRLACGRVRKAPGKTADRPPGDEKCCPTCLRFDDMRLAYVEPVVTERPLVTAEAGALD